MAMSVFLTGSADGIGRATAAALVRAGHRVVLHARNAERARQAEAAVPDALVDEIALCGPPERIRERLALWRGAGVTTLVCATSQPEAIRVMAELVL